MKFVESGLQAADLLRAVSLAGHDRSVVTASFVGYWMGTREGYKVFWISEDSSGNTVLSDKVVNETTFYSLLIAEFDLAEEMCSSDHLWVRPSMIECRLPKEVVHVYLSGAYSKEMSVSPFVANPNSED